MNPKPPAAVAPAVSAAKLAALIATIRKAERRYFEVGQALDAMRRLFHDSQSFEAKAQTAFGWVRSTIYRKIQAAEIAAEVRMFGPIPDFEQTAMMLAPLDGSQRKSVWKKICVTGDQSPDRVARLVEEALGRPWDAAPGERSSSMVDEILSALPGAAQESVAEMQRAREEAKESRPAAVRVPDWRERAEKIGGWLEKARREAEGEGKFRKLLGRIEEAMDELGACVGRMGT